MSSNGSETSSVANQYGHPIRKWNVSGLTNFSRVFDPDRSSPLNLSRASSDSFFDEDLSGWNVSAAKTMFGMFFGAASFHQNLSSWDVRHVQDMSLMFARASSFSGDISLWNVSSVTNMSRIFEDATSFHFGSKHVG